jgi:uncharacterized protein (DUF305 family)
MKRSRKRTTNWIALFVIGLATAVFAHDPKGKPGPMNASLEPLKGAEFEQSLLQQMIQHHRSGIEMAKLATQQTKRTELRDFARKMIPSQEQEIDKMSGWLKSWYNASPKEVANEAANKEMKMHMSMFSGKRDADFDKAFLEMMPKHHHGAVEMSEQAEKKATHPELKQLAAKMAKDQQNEIQQMKNWAQAWFGPVG